MKLVRNQRGFSLIELMVVVAIIGILAAIAIPNFNRYQNRARQTEGKNYLAAIYTGEKSFFAEWGTYVGCMAPIGFAPEGKGSYRAGFATSGVTTVTGYNGGAACSDANVAPTTAPSAALTAPGSLPASTAANMTFTAAAAGNVGGAQEDQWSINETKTLNNTQSGIN